MNTTPSQYSITTTLWRVNEDFFEAVARIQLALTGDTSFTGTVGGSNPDNRTGFSLMFLEQNPDDTFVVALTEVNAPAYSIRSLFKLLKATQL